MNTLEVGQKRSHLGKFVVWESDCHGNWIRPKNVLVKDKISLLRNKPQDVVEEYVDEFWNRRTQPRPSYISVFYRGKTKGPKVEVFKVKRNVEHHDGGGVITEMKIEKIAPPVTQRELYKLAADCQRLYKEVLMGVFNGN